MKVRTVKASELGDNRSAEHHCRDKPNQARRARAPRKHGDKRDYPKIDIFINGNFTACTTWSRTCKEAVDRFIETHQWLGRDTVTAKFR